MPKYMYSLRYTQSGLEGTLKEGFGARDASFRRIVESNGGKTEALYWAYGDVDAYVIVDLPDSAAAIGVSLAANRTGAFRFSTIPLLSAAEMDAARGRMPDYRPPGA